MAKILIDSTYELRRDNFLASICRILPRVKILLLVFDPLGPSGRGEESTPFGLEANDGGSLWMGAAIALAREEPLQALRLENGTLAAQRRAAWRT